MREGEEGRAALMLLLGIGWLYECAYRFRLQGASKMPERTKIR